MDQGIWRKKRRPWKWIFGILALLLLLCAGAAWMLFGYNQFSLSLELAGEPEVNLEFGREYIEPGTRVILRGDQLLQAGITPKDAQVRIHGEVDPGTLGKYTLTYSAEFLWWTAQAERTVRVVDMERPVIILKEDDQALVLPGMPYQEPGFTATDNYDGDITDRVVRTEELGRITYAVYDSSGNPAYAVREIPYYDPIPPEIVLEKGDYLAINTGTWFEDPGYSASDNADGDLTEQVSVEGKVIWYEAGTYPLTYTVADSYGNTTTVQRTVEVCAQPRPEPVDPGGKVIYLTFDDGPGPYTPELLAVLEKYGVKATFFVTDTGYDDVMREIVSQGHSIGIHTMSHNYEEIYASPEAYFADLRGMQEIIYRNTGVQTSLMRFPGGSSNTVSSFNEGVMTLLTEAVQDAGYQYFDWNVDSNDAGGARKSGTVVNNVTAGVSQHRISVVLQHDIHPFSVEAVEEIILWGLNNGYTFLPLRENSPPMHHGVNN